MYVKIFQLVLEVKYLPHHIDAFAQQITFGMEVLAFIPHVLGGKYGLDQIVCVEQARILMAKCVFNVSMVKFGIKTK